MEEPTIDCKTHKDDVIVRCSNSEITKALPPGTIRLVDATGAPSTTGTGRLEMLYNGSFGSICNESWTRIAEKIACLEMGYSGVHKGGASHKQCEDLGLCAPILNKISGVGFNCTGSESRLSQCPHEADNDIYCTHKQDVVISCSGNGDTSEFRHLHQVEPYIPKLKSSPKLHVLACYDTMETITALQGPTGHFFLAQCPEGCKDEPTAVYGTFVYKSNSPICKAAIHSGALSNELGGEILVSRGMNQAHFYGSSRNGIESSGASANVNDFGHQSMLISRAPRNLIASQLASANQVRQDPLDLPPFESHDKPGDAFKFKWTPNVGFEGFKGNAQDIVNLTLYPGSEAIRGFKDATFIIDFVPTSTLGQWSTLLAFENCGGLLVSIDNTGELVLEENCKPHLLKTGYKVEIGKGTILGILYVGTTRDIAVFINGQMILHEPFAMDLNFSGKIILGASSDNSDLFHGHIRLLEAYNYVLTLQQLKNHATSLKQPMHHTGVRTTVHGNVCKSSCTSQEQDATESVLYTTPTNPAIILDCHDTLEDERFNGPTGSEFLIYCPKSCHDAQVPVRGSKLYTGNSSICKAGMHAGILSPQGGEAIVKVHQGQVEHKPCVGHYGIVSSRGPAAVRSFSVNSAPQVLNVGCHDNAIFILQLHPETRVLVQCPPGCDKVEPALVYGSGPYSPISSPCQAAIHAGKMDTTGGQVELEVGHGMEKFQPSLANKIQSKEADAYLRSFTIVSAGKAAKT
ncbi:bifunctional LCCL domain/LCCL domain superfamily/SRCR-like domain superfamily/SRCR-like domain/SRCR domain/Concanavalin A-like lectin-glucanase domain superfamily [Babesia duncani]|nr:bifunctional LCCL domain/LCCL domain superfamily/SRCR-like domain superfamily/SRCR-like domain/SRCR domain/Concanavalin A-like lectin-glucanase domain superfamily [Babesia duncani]